VLRLSVDGVALECERHGDPATGPEAPLVFLHEGLGSLTQWQGFPTDLCTRTGRPGLAWARAGHGRSQPRSGQRDVDYMHHEARVVLPEVLDRFGVDRPVLVGHSDGASIALIAAAALPDRFAGLVLMAPHVIVEPCTLAGIAAAGEAFRAGALSRRLARHHDDIERLFWSWHDAWLSPPFEDWDLTGLLRSVRAPVLLIQGDADQYGTMRQLDLIEQGVTGTVTRVELAGCGHSPHAERREATVEAVVSFLAGLPGSW
jgi:pimeloyl-ACP methyl ester carboxylesterase